jgi:hypothetical protein
MSKKHNHHEAGLFDGLGIGGRKPSLPQIIILILIILQFSKGNYSGPIGDNAIDGFNGADNGILFIIALFYLSCCNSCKASCC